MADEAGEDGGQTMASPVQDHSRGGSLYRRLGAAAICNGANEEERSELLGEFSGLPCLIEPLWSI